MILPSALAHRSTGWPAVRDLAPVLARISLIYSPLVSFRDFSRMRTTSSTLHAPGGRAARVFGRRAGFAPITVAEALACFAGVTLIGLVRKSAICGGGRLQRCLRVSEGALKGSDFRANDGSHRFGRLT